jgi:hypothetical protein
MEYIDTATDEMLTPDWWNKMTQRAENGKQRHSVEREDGEQDDDDITRSFLQVDSPTAPRKSPAPSDT